MSIKEIVTYPHAVLKNPAQEIREIDFELLSLVQDMESTLYRAPGVGLAAPQVGSARRLILVDPAGRSGSGSLVTVINPVIVEQEGSQTGNEMCLSVPEIAVDIKRATRILVRGLDLNGKEIEMEAEGFLARIFQHEIDHLDGRVILDYASALKRSIYLKKRKKGKV